MYDTFCIHKSSLLFLKINLYTDVYAIPIYMKFGIIVKFSGAVEYIFNIKFIKQESRLISTEQKNNLFYLMRCVMLSYIITFLVLAVLALLLYKLSLGKGILSGILIVLYVAVNILSGVLVGRHMKEKRFMPCSDWPLAE